MKVTIKVNGTMNFILIGPFPIDCKVWIKEKRLRLDFIYTLSFSPSCPPAIPPSLISPRTHTYTQDEAYTLHPNGSITLPVTQFLVF